MSFQIPDELDVYSVSGLTELIHRAQTEYDTVFSTVCEAVPMREVPDLDHRAYEPGGMTALYDAIGHTMRITDDFVAANKPDQVLFVIMTDGEENSSREFDRKHIFQMIDESQHYLARFSAHTKPHPSLQDRVGEFIRQRFSTE